MNVALIQRYTLAIGIGTSPATRDPEFEMEESDAKTAEAWIQQFIADFDHHGFNDEQGYWWYRNKGDKVVSKLVIR
jgi:hypothetical protein